jgi:hypothetical protein
VIGGVAGGIWPLIFQQQLLLLGGILAHLPALYGKKFKQLFRCFCHLSYLSRYFAGSIPTGELNLPYGGWRQITFNKVPI